MGFYECFSNDPTGSNSTENPLLTFLFIKMFGICALKRCGLFTFAGLL